VTTQRPGTRHQLDVPTLIQANGVDLCVQTLGNPEHPPVLLIHGAAATLMAWPDDFVTQLADGDRFVIRYDHRDTGQSVSYPPGSPPYDLRDLVADAVGILDWFELAHAHIVGISMGGGIAQILGVEHPDRVASLTMIATSPGGPDLPPMSDEFLNFVQNQSEPDWSNHDEVAEHVLGMLRVFSGNKERFDEPRLRTMVESDLRRSTAHPASTMINHFRIDPGEPIRSRLGAVTAPSLVIHGDCDPVFPIGHAYALANEVPAATLLELEGVGHVVPWQATGSVVQAILRHTQGTNL
jgi:pimeloyl-ACP methyl ester carboxylesterase